MTEAPVALLTGVENLKVSELAAQIATDAKLPAGFCPRLVRRAQRGCALLLIIY